MFSIYDVKAKAYLPPFSLPKEQMAVREFSDCVNNEKHQFGKHPEDYSLHQIGTFDDETSLLLNNENSKILYTGLQLVNSTAKGNQENGTISHETPVQPSTKSPDS